ncbi:MAG: hypothetical protein HGJ93_15760 [Desulfosarcina sp.]|nr:hypothetical protein [Desulfosarcina sp.]MBC2767355.1 hypothetical protein [Desulfosarcina sp.]
MTHLLFVTADRSNFADFSSAIEKQGSTISWAPSGSQALETIGQKTIDLVVTDEG